MTILNTATDSVQVPLMSHRMACYVDLSPDGNWAASGGWHSGDVRLWNVRNGEMVHEWNLGRANVFFTPDSRTLIIAGDGEFSFWDVESRRPIRRITRQVNGYPGYVAFSPGGALIAVEMAPGFIHLLEVATGRIVAQLENPYGNRAGWMSFALGGTRLVLADNDSHAIHVWDLRAVRSRLKSMGLDWDWPEFSPATDAEIAQLGDPLPPARVVSDHRCFQSHTAPVRGAVFLPGETEVLSAAYDLTVRRWELSSGKELGQFTGHTAPLTSVAVSPDGRCASIGRH